MKAPLVPGSSLSVSDDGTHAETALAATEAHQPAHHLARPNTLHLQDHIPFKPATTRFPPRKPLPNQQIPRDEYEMQQRPLTIYLADHHPHLIAPLPPKTSTGRPNYGNEMTDYEGHVQGGGFQNVELQNAESQGSQSTSLATGGNSADDEGKDERKMMEDAKRRHKNVIVISVVLSALVVAIILFAIFVAVANKPR